MYNYYWGLSRAQRVEVDAALDAGTFKPPGPFARNAALVKRLMKEAQKAWYKRSPRRNPHPTIDKRRRTRAAAQRFWDSLTSAEKWDLGDELVHGSFDWENWLTRKPTVSFMNALDQVRMHWEIQSNPPWDSWGSKVPTKGGEISGYVVRASGRDVPNYEAYHVADVADASDAYEAASHDANDLQLEGYKNIRVLEDCNGRLRKVPSMFAPRSNPKKSKSSKAFHAGYKAGLKRKGGKPKGYTRAALQAYIRGYRMGKKKGGWRVMPQKYGRKKWEKHLTEVDQQCDEPGVIDVEFEVEEDIQENPLILGPTDLR